MLLKEGALIDEFRVVKLLGSGAAGIVYLVQATANVSEHVRCAHRYALKLYNDWALSQPNQAERIRREFESSQKVKHSNLVDIYLFRHLHGDPPRSYLIMEMLEGRTLLEFVRSSHPLSIDVIEALFRQLLAAVYALHHELITHRDIKPQNIYVDSGNKLTLLDLGVARDELAKTITPSEQFLGTIRYAAPEMLFGRPYQYESKVDLYSIGASLFFMLTSEEPFARYGRFTDLIIHKEKGSHLSVPTEWASRSKRHLLLSRLVDWLTTPAESWSRASHLSEKGNGRRLEGTQDVIRILDDPFVELSNWWLSFYDANLDSLKSALIRYLDPRLPPSRSERVDIFVKTWRPLWSSYNLKKLRQCLQFIETEAGLKELDEKLAEIDKAQERADDEIAEGGEGD